MALHGSQGVAYGLLFHGLGPDGGNVPSAFPLRDRIIAGIEHHFPQNGDVLFQLDIHHIPTGYGNRK